MSGVEAAGAVSCAAGAGQRVSTLEASFEALYQRHKDAVYRLALRYGAGRSAWAEDVVQDVFVCALDRCGSLGDDELGAWLYRVTTNRCLTRLRRERVLDAITGLLTGARATERRTPERVVGGGEQLARVERWFEQLPAKEMVAFAMRFHDGRSQVEIAEVMGLSKGYVSKLLARVDAKLRLVLEADDE